IFGMKQGWEEMHQGADIRLPKIFYYIIQWVTSTFVLLIVVWWLGGSFKDKLMMAGVPPESRPFLWLARIMMVGMLIFLLAGIHRAWKTHPKFFETVEKEPIEP
ncbi:MAG TPA: hypothetical protein PLX03_03735, partial [Candidatus Hydrogenedentes bacterium]|nr:hypothetical protein [Candidatus Hydrogenedentota bacterium]